MSYRRKIPTGDDGRSDVYDVLSAYKVDCPARCNAVKKILCPGQRGAKGEIQDLQEAAKCIARAIELAQGRLVAVPHNDVAEPPVVNTGAYLGPICKGCGFGMKSTPDGYECESPKCPVGKVAK